jgi:hypothetical protein
MEKSMNRLLRFLSLALILAQSSIAMADEYIVPTETSLIQTLLRFGAVDINNDVIIDDYAKIAECDLYSVFRDDDFKWNKIRAGLRNKIRNESVTYPSNYLVKGYISLDRYDFETKTFKINTNSPILGVNAFRLMDYSLNSCRETLKGVPKKYTAVIENRINIPGFIMSESDAQALLGRLIKDGNNNRQILTKFNLRIIDVPKLKIDYSMMDKWYDKQTYVGKNDLVDMTAKLDSIEFFEDDAMKRRLFVYRP